MRHIGEKLALEPIGVAHDVVLLLQDAVFFLELLAQPLAWGNIPADDRCADDLVLAIANRRHGHRHIDVAAILGLAHGFIAIDDFAALNTRQDLFEFYGVIRCHQKIDGLSPDLLFCIAVDALGALVPRYDLAG